MKRWNLDSIVSNEIRGKASTFKIYNLGQVYMTYNRHLKWFKMMKNLKIGYKKLII